MQSTAVFLLYRYSGNGDRVIPNPGSVTDGDRCTLGGPLYFVAWFMAHRRLEKNGNRSATKP